MKAKRKATKAMSRIAGGLFRFLGVAALLPELARAHFMVEIVAVEQAPQRDGHQHMGQGDGEIVDHMSGNAPLRSRHPQVRISSHASLGGGVALRILWPVTPVLTPH